MKCVLIFIFYCTVGKYCDTRMVELTLQSETWKSALNNKASIEFKTLQANLLSEVSIPQHLVSAFGGNLKIFMYERRMPCNSSRSALIGLT